MFRKRRDIPLFFNFFFNHLVLPNWSLSPKPALLMLPIVVLILKNEITMYYLIYLTYCHIIFIEITSLTNLKYLYIYQQFFKYVRS